MEEEQLRLRRRSEPELRQQLRDLMKETETYKKAFQKTSIDEIETKLRIAKEYIDAFTRESLKKVEILDRMSPTTAKELEFKLKNWREIAIMAEARDLEADTKAKKS